MGEWSTEPERREGIMRGTITARDVIRHGATILRIWGPSCWLHCLAAALSPRPSTFLEVLCRCGVVQPGGRR